MKSDGSLYRQIGVVVGWILYCVGWARTTQITSRREPLYFVIFFAGAALLLKLTVRLWVAHNKRLATSGRRGVVTRYTVPSYSHDHLGRTLVFAPEVSSGREITISVTAGTKLYSAVQATGNAAELAEYALSGLSD